MVLLMLMTPALADGSTIYYTATLSGSAVVPPTGSPATGSALLTLTDDLLTVDLSFSGLTAPATQGHIHCCMPPGPPVLAIVLAGFPLATSGTYSHVFDLLDLNTYTANFRNIFGGGTAAGAEAALIAAFNESRAYFDIPNANFGGGEVRGQISPMPEPATLPLVALGALGLAAARWRTGRKRSA